MAPVARRHFKQILASHTDATSVLVASSSEVIRRRLAGQLSRYGYKVIESPGRLDVLNRVSVRPRRGQGAEPVELLVLDISDDPWPSLALVEAIRREDWALPVILITREVELSVYREADRLDVKHVLCWPFDPSRIQTTAMSLQPPFEASACA